ncbi:unnamed protein product [Cunninghamella echinulata]
MIPFVNKLEPEWEEEISVVFMDPANDSGLMCTIISGSRSDQDHHYYHYNPWLYLQQLQTLYLLDTNIHDDHIMSILNTRGALNMFILESIQISVHFIQTILRDHRCPLLVQIWKFIDNKNR